MKRLALAGALAAMCGCGYMGSPLPPLANVPMTVTNLAAVQRGEHIIVQFSVPLKTTEGQPIPGPLKLDLRGGTAEHFEPNQWAATAKQIPPAAPKDGIARYEIASGEWARKEVIFGVRVVAGNGKHSDWSNWAVVLVVPAPQKPDGVAAEATAHGVRLTWRAAGPAFRVFRKTGSDAFAPVANVQTPEWIDAAAEFGKPYTYLVQSIVKLGNEKEAESELAGEITITPRDTFPPAAPKGLQASVAPNSIELHWDRSPEEDVAGYRVYRAIGSAAPEKVADVSVVPNFSDRKVERGKTYRYQVTAVDGAGNESERSAAAEATLL